MLLRFPYFFGSCSYVFHTFFETCYVCWRPRRSSSKVGSGQICWLRDSQRGLRTSVATLLGPMALLETSCPSGGMRPGDRAGEPQPKTLAERLQEGSAEAGRHSPGTQGLSGGIQPDWPVSRKCKEIHCFHTGRCQNTYKS